jgi:hypothetical protein
MHAERRESASSDSWLDGAKIDGVAGTVSFLGGLVVEFGRPQESRYLDKPTEAGLWIDIGASLGI